jgi:DNA-binding MarR family transcriptional regulator
MSKSPPARDELLQTLDETLRKVSAQSVLLNDTVAKLVGANPTDLECLDLLGLGGPTTAGKLASHTGLTTGATTAVIDRLERAGFARRLRNTEDRRRVLVEALPERLRQIEALYQPLAVAVARLNEDYGDRQLAVIVDYLSRAVTLAAEHVVWLQTQQPLPSGTPARRPRRRRGATARPAARRSEDMRE